MLFCRNKFLFIDSAAFVRFSAGKVPVNGFRVNCVLFCGDRLHRKKKVREFPVPSRDVTTKLSLGGNTDVITELFLPRGSLVSDIPAGDGKLVNLFLRCTVDKSAAMVFFCGDKFLLILIDFRGNCVLFCGKCSCY